MAEGQIENFPAAVPEFIQQIQNEVPEEYSTGPICGMLDCFKLSIPLISKRIYELVNFNTGKTEVDNLLKILNEGTEVTKECLVRAIDYQNKCGLFDKFQDTINTFTGCTSKEELIAYIDDNLENLKTIRDKMVEGLQNIRQEMADNMIRGASLSSAIIIATETVRLLKIWSTIREAKNLIMDISDRRLINANFAIIEDHIETLTKLLTEQMSQEKPVEKERKKILQARIDEEIYELREIMLKTQHLIGSARIKINNEIKTLRDKQGTLGVSIISNVAHLAVNSVQLASGWGAASAFWRQLGSVAIASLGLVTAAQIGAYFITEKTLEELRLSLTEVEVWEAQLSAFQKKAREINRWAQD